MTYWDEKMGRIMAQATAEPRNLLLGKFSLGLGVVAYAIIVGRT